MSWDVVQLDLMLLATDSSKRRKPENKSWLQTALGVLSINGHRRRHAEHGVNPSI